MFCPQCGNDVKDGIKFCGHCGWAVPAAPVQSAQSAGQHCATCGTALKEGARFCPNCGATVYASSPAPAVPPIPAVPAAPVQSAQPAGQRCAICGTALKEGARFCPNCGAAVSAAPAVSQVPPVSEPVPPSTDTAAQEAVKTDKTEPQKSGAIDKAVFYCLGGREYACYLYKDGVVAGSITDTQGAFISDVKEWLEKTYDNLVVEINDKG